jgi:hypothetical protein
VITVVPGSASSRASCPPLGLIGAPLLLPSEIAIFFDLYDRAATVAVLTALPIAFQEFSLGVYSTVRGFRPAAVAALPSSEQAR